MFSVGASQRVILDLGRLTAIAAICLLPFLAACASGDTEGTADVEPTDGGNSEAGEPVVPIASGAVATVDFVSAAIEGDDAPSFFADDPLPDDQLGVPFEPDLLMVRLGELRNFAGSVEEVRPSAAYADAADGQAPSCDTSSALYCQVDLMDSNDGVLASVIVYWFGDGVTDFSILSRSSDGAINGIGEARCSAGLELIHGGHTPDRFDIAVCIDQSGAVQYNGKERGTDLGIRLDGCQQGPRTWIAENEGFRYEVNGSTSPVRTLLDVTDPNGESILNGPLSSVAIDHAVTPTFC